MVRNRRRTSTRQSWDELAMAKAIEAVINGQMGYPRASVAYNVPQTTLERRVRLYRENPDMELATMKGLGRFETVFSPTQENELVKYLQNMENRLHGLTATELKILAWQLAEQNGIRHSFNNGMAGEGWMRGFLKRNSILSLRKPESTSAARARGFNMVVVNNFQTLLEQTIEKYNLTPNRIYNVDETGCSTVPKHISKIIATKGKRQVGVVTSGERGQLVTVEMCASASGRYLPPMFIFPRVRMVASMMTGAPEGSWGVCHPSGWMQSEIFFEWFKWFVEIIQPSKEEPVLLLLDGHTTHTRNLEVIDYAKEHHVILLCFPPHCTHKLQPLDVSVMRPLSIYYAAEVKQWMRLNPGRVVNPAQIPALFGRAFEKAATAQTAINGFRKAGIWPFNRGVFSEEDFMPAEVTNRPQPCSTEEMIPTNEWTRVVESERNLQDSSIDETFAVGESELILQDPSIDEELAVAESELDLQDSSIGAISESEPTPQYPPIDETLAVAESELNLQDSSIGAISQSEPNPHDPSIDEPLAVAESELNLQDSPISDNVFCSFEEITYFGLTQQSKTLSHYQSFSAQEFCNSDLSSNTQFFSAEEDFPSQSQTWTRADETNLSQAHLDVHTPFSVENVFEDSIPNVDDVHPTEADLSSRKSMDRVNVCARQIRDSPSNLSMEPIQLLIPMSDKERLGSPMVPRTDITVFDDSCAISTPRNLNICRGVDVLDELSQSLSQASIQDEEEIVRDPQPHCSKVSPPENPGPSRHPTKQPRISRVPFRPSVIFSSSEDEERTPMVVPKNPTTFCKRKFNRLTDNEFSVSPYEIQPLPVADEIQPRKRRAHGKAAVLTNSPYREELFQQKQAARHPKKAGKLKREGPESSGKRKGAGNRKGSGKTKNAKLAKTASRDDASSEDVPCLFCKGLYSESTEGWIQCQSCGGWSHESCAGIDTDELVKFECDFCKI